MRILIPAAPLPLVLLLVFLLFRHDDTAIQVVNGFSISSHSHSSPLALHFHQTNVNVNVRANSFNRIQVLVPTSSALSVSTSSDSSSSISSSSSSSSSINSNANKKTSSFESAALPLSMNDRIALAPTPANTKSISTSATASESQSSLSSSDSDNDNNNEYRRGLAIISFITLMFSSNSPILHAAFVNSSNPPSVLLLNAATSSIALMGLITFGPMVNSIVPLPSTLKEKESQDENTNINTNTDSNIDSNTDADASASASERTQFNFNVSLNKDHIVAGTELGFWKTLGTTANLYGLSLTSANHASFLIQLTTLIVPSVQGLMGVPVPKRIWTSIGLALSGIFLFTQDVSSGMTGGSDGSIDAAMSTMLLGDALCVVAAAFYATYDLRLFSYGKKVPPLPLIRTKISVQALLSCILLAVLGENGGLNEVMTYVQSLVSSSSSSSLSSSNDLFLVGSAVLWSGLIINALVPFLQVSGQQTIGASRAQVIYASQPLWASILSFFLLGETLGESGLMGGFLFLSAIFLAASAESPDADCGDTNCEV